MDGAAVLEEVPGELGVLLWRSVRDVALWAITPPEKRASLFDLVGSAAARIERLTSTEVPEEIAPSLDTIHAMLLRGADADTEIVSLCCLEVAAWARMAGCPRTAVAFAQAGARLSPGFAEAALHTGLYAMAAGQEVRAESWLRRTVALARREGDRIAYADALVELAAIHERRGSIARARRGYERAYRAARRFGAASARGRAAYGLFRLARQRRAELDAPRFAVLALRGAADTPNPATVLLDLARFWTDLGDFARVDTVLRRFRRIGPPPSPAVHLEAAALAARAAVAIPSRDAEWAQPTAWELMRDTSVPDDVRLSAAMHAAHSAGDLPGFNRARNAVLTIAPRSAVRRMAAAVSELWPAAASTAPAGLERAS